MAFEESLNIPRQNTLPAQCQNLNNNADAFNSYLFPNNDGYEYVLIALTTIVFLAIGIRFYQLRFKVWMKARSPKLILLSVFFLYLDIIGNIVVFSG